MAYKEKSFVVPGRPELIDSVRIAVGLHAELAGLNEEARDDLDIALREGCKNILCHGRHGHATEYKVTVKACDKKIKVMLEDVSTKQRIMDKSDRRICLNCPKEGEICEDLINALVDETQFIYNGKQTKKIIMVKSNV